MSDSDHRPRNLDPISVRASTEVVYAQDLVLALIQARALQVPPIWPQIRDKIGIGYPPLQGIAEALSDWMADNGKPPLNTPDTADRRVFVMKEGHLQSGESWELTWTPEAETRYVTVEVVHWLNGRSVTPMPLTERYETTLRPGEATTFSYEAVAPGDFDL